MADIESCPECHVPRRLTDTYVWLAGGVLAQRHDQKHRFALIEIDNLDPLYKSIEEIIGIPIEHLVIEAKRKATRMYMKRLIPKDIRDLVLKKELSVELMIDGLNATGNVMGYGNASLVAYSLEFSDDDFITERIENPYSVPLWCGDLTGSSEAVAGFDLEVKYRWVSEYTIEITCLKSAHPLGFEEKLRINEYEFQDEGIQLIRCSTCGGPFALSTYEWHPDEGIIKSRETGRRLAFVGPVYQDAIFDDLERELGETIPTAIIEAQRRFVKSGFYNIKEIQNEEDFRRQLALRGLGDLQEINLSRSGLKATIRNAAMHLIMAGLLQGYYETVSGSDSGLEWEMKDNGTLDLRIAPKG